jgi:hypothetical protein
MLSGLRSEAGCGSGCGGEWGRAAGWRDRAAGRHSVDGCRVGSAFG